MLTEMHEKVEITNGRKELLITSVNHTKGWTVLRYKGPLWLNMLDNMA